MDRFKLEQDILRFSTILEDLKETEGLPENAVTILAYYEILFDNLWHTFTEYIEHGEKR